MFLSGGIMGRKHIGVWSGAAVLLGLALWSALPARAASSDGSPNSSYYSSPAYRNWYYNVYMKRKQAEGNSTAKAEPAPTPAPGHATITVDQGGGHPWAVEARGGIPAPAGDFANFVKPSGAGNLEVMYSPMGDISVDAFYEFASFQYKDTLASQPMTANGFGLKGIFRVADIQQFAPYLDFGMGFYELSQASADYSPVAGTTNSVTTVQYKSNTGLGWILGGGVEYQIAPQILAVLDAGWHSISVAGGTGDNVQYLLFSAGAAYQF